MVRKSGSGLNISTVPLEAGSIVLFQHGKSDPLLGQSNWSACDEVNGWLFAALCDTDTQEVAYQHNTDMR